ncbi:hypothetical protein VPH35_071421 [Triticum aestivum]
MAAGSLAMPALLVVVALLACAAARGAVVAGGAACVGALCAMGTCKELQGTIPFGYECECDPGWSWPNFTFPPPLPPHLFLPCTIPTCLSISEFTCYRPKPPNPANATLDPCSYTDCGSEGTCVSGEGRQYRCQCKPGANVKGDPTLPCTSCKSTPSGKNCATDANGCPVSSPTTPAPPSPSSSTAPPSPSSSTAPPGSVSSRNRLRLSLLLASLAALHAVIV